MCYQTQFRFVIFYLSVLHELLPTSSVSIREAPTPVRDRRSLFDQFGLFLVELVIEGINVNMEQTKHQ